MVDGQKAWKQLPFLNALCGCGLALLFWLMPLSNATAQEHEGEFWVAYISSISFHEKWRIWNDFHYTSQSFYLNRHGLTYQGRADLQWSGGYAYVRTSTAATTQIIRPEHRAWGQVLRNFQLHDKWRYVLRYRYDARFRATLGAEGLPAGDAFTFNHRHRIMQQLRYTVKTYPQGAQLHVDLMNETLVNSGRKIDFGLDQVRTYALAGYTGKSFTFLAGYHQRFFPDRGNHSRFRHGLTCWVIHRLSLQKVAELPEETF